MSSLLATVLAAVRPGSMPHDLDDIEAEPDANASMSQTPLQEATLPGGNMSTLQAASGTAVPGNATAPAASAASALAVITSVMSAEAIKGDAGRMSAAIALMALAPALAADSVVTFVAEHVPAAASAAIAPATQEAAAATQVAGTPATMSYAGRRVAAAQLAMPSPPKAAGNDGLSPSKVFAARRAAVKGA